VGSHGNGKHFYRQRLALHGDIALGIRGGAADNADVNRKRFVGQVLLAVDGHQLDDILGGAVVDLAAAVTRIDVGPQADSANVPGAMGGDIAKQMRDHSLGQVVSLDLASDRQRLQLRHQSPMAANDAFHQTHMTKVIQPAFLSVALSGGIEERQVARPSAGGAGFLFRRQELLLDGDGNPFGKGDAHEASGRNCIAIANQAHGIGGGDDFVPLRRSRGGQRGYRVGLKKSGQRIGRHSNSPSEL